MADLNAVLQALVLADQQAKANSPYAPVSQFTEQMNPTILQAAGSGQYKPGESMAAGLINGLIGGFSQNLTNSYADKQNNLAYQAMSNAMTGKGGKPEGINPSVFAPIQAAGGVFKLGRGFEQEDEDRRLQQQVRSNLALKGVRVNEDDSYEAIPGAVDAFNAIEGISPMIQNAIYKTRMGEQLSPEEQQAVASAPMGVQRQISNYEYQQGVQGRFEENIGQKKTLAYGAEFAKIGKAFDGLDAVKEAKTMLGGASRIEGLLSNDITNIDVGILKSQVAKAIAGEKGVLTDRDVERNLPPTLKGRATGIYNFLTGETSGPLTQNQVDALLAITEGVKQNAMSKIDASRQEVKKRASREAQMIMRSPGGENELDSYLEGLALSDLVPSGMVDPIAPAAPTATSSAGQQPQAAQYSEQDLISAGYSAEDIQALKAQGAIR